MVKPANKILRSDLVLLIALLNEFIALATSQPTLPSTITLSPDPNRAEIGSWLKITCSTTGVFSKNDFRSARLSRRFQRTLVEVDSSQLVTMNDRTNRGPISFEIEQTNMTVVTFTVYNVTLSDAGWSPFWCQAVFERQGNDFIYNSIDPKFFNVVGSVGVPSITWNQPSLKEGEFMPPVTCTANLGYPLETASLSLIHLSSNGSQLDDVRLDSSRRRTMQLPDGTYSVEDTYDIGCWSGSVCSRLSKTNHGDWLVCLAQNSNSTSVKNATARKQLRVLYRMSSMHIVDGEGRVLPGLGDRKPPASMGTEVIDVVNFTPSNTDGSLRFVCKANGEPSPSVTWFSVGNKLAHILPSPNSSVLTLDLTSKTGFDTFECLAIQHMPEVDPTRLKVVLSLNITTAAIATASYDNRLLIILVSGGVVAVVITGFVSVCCLRRFLCRSSTNRGTSRRARSLKKGEIGETQNRMPSNVTGNGFDAANDGLDLALNVQLDDKPRSRKPIVEVEDGLKQYPYTQQESNFYSVNSTSTDVNGNTMPPTASIIPPSALQYPIRAPFISADSL